MKFKIGAIMLVAGLVVAGPSLASSVEYKYDALGRLTEAKYSNGRQVTYKYDAAGNRTEMIVVPGSDAARVVVLPLLGGLVIPLP